MKIINELIKNNQLQEAIELMTAEVTKKENDPDYAEKTFTLGMLWLRRYEQTKPVNNQYAEEVRAAFASSETAYVLQHGKSSEKYREAEGHVKQAISVLNMRTDQ